MRYNPDKSEKNKSDILILKEIAKNRGFSGRILDYVAETLAERIDIIENHYSDYQKLEEKIKQAVNIADNLTKTDAEKASSLYHLVGKTYLGLAGKLNDKNFAEKAKKIFLSSSEGYITLSKNLKINCEDKKEEYTYLSGENKFLSENVFKLKEIISDYYALRKNMDVLIKEISFKSYINYPVFTNKLLDNINRLRDISPNSDEAIKIKKIISNDSVYMPEGAYDKIKELIDKISPGQKD